MRPDIERKRRLARYPAKIRAKFEELGAACGHPLDQEPHLQVTKELYDYLEVLSFDFPDRFGPFVDAEIAIESEAKIKRAQELGEDEDKVQGRLITRFVHPSVSRRKRALAEIERGRAEAKARAAKEEPLNWLNTKEVAMSSPIRHKDTDDDDVEMFSRPPSPGPPERAPSRLGSPVTGPLRRGRYRPATPPPEPQASTQVTPTKRSSVSGDDGSPSKRGRLTPESERAPGTPASTVRRGLGGLNIQPPTPVSPSPARFRGNSLEPQPELAAVAPPPVFALPVSRSASSTDSDVSTVHVVLPNPYQDLFDRNDIKFHVQWELELKMCQARLEWFDFNESDLQPFKNASATTAAPRIPTCIDQVSQRKNGTLVPDAAVAKYGRAEKEKRLLAEVDFEEKSIRDDRMDGLLSNNPQWPYGGKICYTVFVEPLQPRQLAEGVLVHQKAASRPESPAIPMGAPTKTGQVNGSEIIDDPDNPFGLLATGSSKAQTRLLFKMTLLPPSASGKSFRLARRYGSRRILNFKFKDPKRLPNRKDMFNIFAGKRFVLFGRVFRALWSPPDKDGVFAVEVGESIDDVSTPPSLRHEPPMPGYLELLETYNDLNLKPEQAMAKWAARPQLLFSDSQPTLLLASSDIDVVPDIVVDLLDHPATTEETLTDGCGLMSADVALDIGKRVDSGKGRPFVVQMRLGGAKGLLAVMSKEQEELYAGKGIVLRKSMVKSLSNTFDQSSLVLDVLRHGGNILRTGTVLSTEAIICLVHQGVPADMIKGLARNALDELRHDLSPTPLSGETEVTARLRLEANVYRRGALHLDHKKRQLEIEGKSARVAGCDFAWGGDSGSEDWPSEGGMSASDRFDIDPVSGQPGSIAESLWMTLQSGFSPVTSAYTRRKLHYFAASQVDRIVAEYRIPVERSVSAFIVPDSLQLLEPHEVFVAFSGEGPRDPDTGCPMSHLLGDVLLYRSPCKLPTDIRKFTAVYRPELAHLKDCIILSASATQCKRSPASFLSGGDYDGDTATVIYDRELVDSFENADDSIATTPAGFEAEYFRKELETGTELLSKLADAGTEAKIAALQKYLLGSMLDEKLTGRYSAFHDAAVYTLGFGDAETIRLARMFCLVLDARKSGLRILPAVARKDQGKYDGTLRWKLSKSGELKREKKKGPTRERSEPLIRPPNLGVFIMDMLLSSNERHGADIKQDFPRFYDSTHKAREDYQHLSATYASCLARIDAYGTSFAGRQLADLQLHVKICRLLWERYKAGLVNTGVSVRTQYRERLAVASATGDGIASADDRKVAGHTRSNNGSDGSGGAAIRALAVVWHEEFLLERVAAICDDDAHLRKLKVGCAATQAGPWEQSMLFDMDFAISRQMKAEKMGPTATLLESSMLALKPAFKPVKYA